MKKHALWISIALLGMAVCPLWYGCEILASLHGIEAVPMTARKHGLFIVWTGLVILGGLCLSNEAPTGRARMTACIVGMVAAGTLYGWLALVYLGKLLPYARLHDV